YAASKWAFIDVNGDLAIPYRFDNAKRFQNGLAPVEVDGSWGYIDRNGDWVIPPRFESASPFEESALADVRIGGKRGLINRRGEVVVEAQYDSIGLAAGYPILVSREDKYGYIDYSGDVLIPLE